jgi:hypothetical protein
MLLLAPFASLSATPQVTKTALPAALTEDQRILHVLNRLGYGPRPGDVERIRRLGLRQYIAQQLHPETIDDSALEARLKNLPTLAIPTAELVNLEAQARQMRQEFLRRQGSKLPENPGEALAKLPPEERRQVLKRYRETFGDEKHTPRRVVSDLQQAKLLRAVYSERQLHEVMTDFWFNHFNVFAGKGLVRVFLNEYERDVIRPHALGRFEDLLRATAHSPAMLFYLDNWQSVTPDLKLPGRERRPFGGMRPGNGQPGQGFPSRGDLGWGRLGHGGLFNRGRGVQRPFPPPMHLPHETGTQPVLPPIPASHSGGNLASTKTMLASCWNCIRSAWTAATPRRMSRKWPGALRAGVSTSPSAASVVTVLPALACPLPTCRPVPSSTAIGRTIRARKLCWASKFRPAAANGTATWC